MYNYITRWGRLMGSYDYYIAQQIEKAKKENAPEDACYFNDFENRWVSYSEINPKVQMKLDSIDTITPNNASAIKDGISIAIILLISLFIENFI